MRQLPITTLKSYWSNAEPQTAMHRDGGSLPAFSQT